MVEFKKGKNSLAIASEFRVNKNTNERERKKNAPLLSQTSARLPKKKGMPPQLAPSDAHGATASDGGPGLRLGVLGAAAIALKNVPAARAAGWVVVAVGSRDPAKAAAFCAKAGLPPSCVRASYAAVIADPTVDAAYIPLPSAVHVEWVRAACAAGKHIVLEKPVSTADAESDAIAAAVTAAGVALLDGTMWVHSARAAALAADLGRLGPLRSVCASFTFCAPPAFFAQPGGDCRTDPSADGALGCLGDLGWYCCRAALWALSGDGQTGDLPATAAAAVGARLSPLGVPLAAGGSLTWADGLRTATFDCAFDRCQTQHLEIGGVEGTATLDDFVIPIDEHATHYTLRLAKPTHDGLPSTAVHRVGVEVASSAAQEVGLWRAFAALVSNDDPAPRRRALAAAIACQRCVNAVARSVRAGGGVEAVAPLPAVLRD